jgi:S1-C subfamily serine protease
MFRRLVWALALLLVAPTAARAEEEWVLIGGNKNVSAYIDINGVTRDGEVAGGWVRMQTRGAERSPNGKRYTEDSILVDFNCKSGLVRTRREIYRDGKGARVDAVEGATTWDTIEKDSNNDFVGHVMCAIATAEQVPDLREGTWRSLNRDKTHEVAVFDTSVAPVDDDRIMFMMMTNYLDYQLLHGLPYSHVVQSVMLDCKRRLSGLVSSRFMLDWTRSLLVTDVDKKNFKLEPVEPGTVAYTEFDRLCKAPRSDLANSGGGGISTGTAWATNKGYLVTASHVIDGGSKIEVYQNSQKIGEAKVVANDPANDVAVLRYVPAGGKKIRIIPLADKPGAMGKSVFTLGFPAPDVMGQAIKMSAGDISATSGIQDDARFMQMSIPIQPGNSGGPVIGFDGAAVGVVSSKLVKLSEDRDAAKPENVNYAVKIAYVRPLLEDLPDLADYVPVKATAGNTEDLIAQAREAVFMLVVTP